MYLALSCSIEILAPPGLLIVNKWYMLRPGIMNQKSDNENGNGSDNSPQDLKCVSAVVSGDIGVGSDC
jgi:hypothetical protein